MASISRFATAILSGETELALGTIRVKVPLILRVGRKWKGQAGDNYNSTLNIEFEQDWSFTLGVTLGDRYKIKNYVSSFRDFSGRSR